MIYVLTALSDQSHIEIVEESLPSECQSISLNSAIDRQLTPDVYIVDIDMWDVVDAWIAKRRTSEFYRLLVIDADNLNTLPKYTQNLIDDIILLPLRTAELRIRLRSMLQMREYSRQIRRIYEKLATTNQALESTGDAVIISDNEGVSVYVNPAFIDLFDYSIAELNQHGIPDVLFEQPAQGEQIFRHVQREGTWKGEVHLKTKNEKILPFLLKVDLILDDKHKPIGSITICSDITLHKIVSTIQEEQRISAEAQLDTARVLSSTLDLDEVFDRMLDNISRVVPNDAANVIVIQDEQVELVDRNDYWDKDQIEQLQNGDTHVDEFDDLRKILETNQPLIISDTEHYLKTHDDMKNRSPWLKSHIGIPINLQDEVIGFLNVDSLQPGLFQPIHAERLQIFAEQAAIAIHNAQLHKNAQKAAMLEERQRLARNLHDAVSQILFSASIIAEAIPPLWERDPDAVFPRLEQIQKLTRGALAEMRSLLMELHPDRFSDTDIDVLIQQLREGVLGQAHLDVKLHIDNNLRLPTDTKIAIYYITQEALNNVVKHARATAVTIHLGSQQGRLTLHIQDDGRGFDTSTIPPTSLGLDNIRERANSTSAKISIISEIGKGTTISVEWLN